MKTIFASSISFLLLSSSFWNNVSYAATTEENPNCATPLGPFEYPADLVRPSMIWVEGFASRLHAQNIQKYETPIAVWQTWRIDQLMWNCIAAFHPEALSAITKERPEYVGDDGYFDSHTRALCIMHGMNKLIPELVPISQMEIETFLDSVGLCNEQLGHEEAVDMHDGGDKSPRVIGTLVADEIINDMMTDGVSSSSRDS